MASAEYTDHAERRMRERRISKGAVEIVLKTYQISRPATRRAGEPSTVIYEGEYQGRMLKVYVERDTNPPKVRTAVWEGD